MDPDILRFKWVVIILDIPFHPATASSLAACRLEDELLETSEWVSVRVECAKVVSEPEDSVVRSGAAS